MQLLTILCDNEARFKRFELVVSYDYNDFMAIGRRQCSSLDLIGKSRSLCSGSHVGFRGTSLADLKQHRGQQSGLYPEFRDKEDLSWRVSGHYI